MTVLFGAPVFAQTNTPSVLSLSPSSAMTGDPGFSLGVLGFNFTASSTVYWNDTPLATSYNGPTLLLATVPSNLLQTAGNIVVSVSNPNTVRSNGVAFTIQTALAISTATLPNGTVGGPYSATLVAAGGTPPYTWTAVTSLPAGLTLSAGGVISGTPLQQGAFTIDVRLADITQRTVTRSLSLTVSPPPLSIVTPTALPTAVVGTEYSVTLTTANGTTPFRWTAVPSLPAGLTLNPTTGVISGVPTLRGNFTFQVQLADSSGLTANKTFTLTVQPQTLTITTLSPLFNGVVGTAYAQTFAATGGTPPYRWSMQPQIPGFTLDATTGALTGTPQSAGQFTISVQVQDTENITVTKTFVFTVDPARLTIATTSPLPDGAVGTPYSIRFTVSGGAAPYVWSVVSGGVPGLGLNTATGALENVPTTAGAFSLTVQARDANGLTATKTFTVTIAGPPLRLATPTQLFTGTIGAPINTTISVVGGTPPYSWEANGLPAGVSIGATTGEISGAPTTGGTFLFTVRVTDSRRAAATELYQLIVSFPSVPALRTTDVPGVAEPAQQPRIAMALEQPYSLPLVGDLILSFAPDAGGGDGTIQFSSGGRTARFRIPAGNTRAEFEANDLALQTGTVAGTLTLTARLQSVEGAEITPTPVFVQSVRVERAQPTITEARFTRTSGGIQVRVTGYTTAREITQAVFRFSASGGATLQNAEVSLPVEDLFAGWFSDPQAIGFGSQFTFTQLFSIQGDTNSITPISVTLTNRLGSATTQVSP